MFTSGVDSRQLGLVSRFRRSILTLTCVRELVPRTTLWLSAKDTVQDRTLILPVLRTNVANTPAAYIDALLDLVWSKYS